MSYFPTDIPYMSEEELKANGIKINCSENLNNSTPRPKPCPFCGWGTIVDGGFLDHKCTCNSCGASTKGYPTWELAVDAWNRRVK